MELTTIQTVKTEIIHNGKVVQLMEYQGQPVNSHFMSPNQTFLLRCREGKKIKDCDLSDFKEMFNKICDFIGVKFQNINEAAETSLKFSQLLKDFWPKKYMKEVLGSYFFAVKGQLLDLENNVIKVYPIIDIRSCSEFLNAFDRYFNKCFEQEMKSQKFWYLDPVDTKPTKEEINQSFINGLDQALAIVKSGQKYDIAGTDLFLFAELKFRGIIILTDEEAETEIQDALKVFKFNTNIERFDKKTSIGRKAELGKLVESVMRDDVRVKNIARRKILNDYLQSWVLSDFTINDILK